MVRNYRLRLEYHCGLYLLYPAFRFTMTEQQVHKEVAEIVRQASAIYLKCHSTGYFKEYKRKIALARSIKVSLDMPYKERVKYLRQFNILPFSEA